ncbi:hypothetical protein AgCh_005201 [Apium graveolens]
MLALMKTDTHQESHLETMERLSVNRAAEKNERVELINLRKKWMALDSFFKKNGISLTDIEREMILEDENFNGGLGSNAVFLNGRQEVFGLLFSKLKPNASRVSEILANILPKTGQVDKMFYEMSNPLLGTTVDSSKTDAGHSGVKGFFPPLSKGAANVGVNVSKPEVSGLNEANAKGNAECVDEGKGIKSWSNVVKGCSFNDEQREI